MKYYLIDLERSMRTGSIHYWKPNKFGYTTDLREAGLYDEKEAKDIVDDDIDKRTVLVSELTVKNILK